MSEHTKTKYAGIAAAAAAIMAVLCELINNVQ